MEKPQNSYLGRGENDHDQDAQNDMIWGLLCSYHVIWWRLES